MSDLSFTTLELGKKALGAAEIQALSGKMHGSLIDENNAFYDEARKVWNGMIDRRPGLIVRCADAADVVAAVRFRM